MALQLSLAYWIASLTDESCMRAHARTEPWRAEPLSHKKRLGKLGGAWERAYRVVALSPDHSQILSRSRGEKSGEGLVPILRHGPFTA